MLPASEYRALPGSPHPADMQAGPDAFPTRRPRAYAAALLAAVGVAAVVAVLHQGGAGGGEKFWVADEAAVAEAAVAEAPAGLETQLPADVVDAMNFSTHPCDNFYEFVCGNWVKNAVIPGSHGSWSKSWDGAGENVHKEMVSLYTDTWPEGSPYGRLHDWYHSCMDLDTIQELGPSPLAPMLARIESLETLADMQDLLVDLVLWDLPHFLNLDVTVGVRKAGTHLLFVQVACVSRRLPYSRERVRRDCTRRDRTRLLRLSSSSAVAGRVARSRAVTVVAVQPMRGSSCSSQPTP
jgi:hypothetical protein